MKFTKEHMQELTQLIEKNPSGISIDSLVAQVTFDCHPRTLQRWLATLIESGVIERIGKGPGSKYLPKIKNESIQSNEILLSSEAQSIKEYVTQSIIGRVPVGYQREFLEEYEPNHSYYLTKEIRDELKALGTSSEGKQPAGTFARQIYNRLLIDLSWNSSRLEGNTYSLLETERLIALGETVEGKSLTETQMIINHKAAIEFIVENIQDISFNTYTIRNIHALLSENLLGNPGDCGRIRNISVGIGGSVYLPPEIPILIEESLNTILNKVSQIEDPFEQAFFLMVHIPYLQPFVDVNKRLSRLSSNIPFIKNNLCPLSFIDVPEKYYIEGTLGIYELNRPELLRDVFVWAYKRSAQRYFAITQTLGEPDPFQLKYRQQIKQIVNEIIKAKMDKKSALKFIQEWASIQLEDPEKTLFFNTVEKELYSLNIGNIARYKVTPNEFEMWSIIWRKSSD